MSEPENGPADAPHKVILTGSMAAKMACLAMSRRFEELGIVPSHDAAYPAAYSKQFVVDFDPDGDIEDVTPFAEALADKVAEFTRAPVFTRLDLPPTAETCAYHWYGGVGVRGLTSYLVHEDKRVGGLDVLVSDSTIDALAGSLEQRGFA